VRVEAVPCAEGHGGIHRAMADGLADTDGPPTAQGSVTQWITENKDSLGRRYANEVDRHFR